MVSAAPPTLMSGVTAAASASAAAPPAGKAARAPGTSAAAASSLRAERSLVLFGLPAGFEVKRLWKRVRKLKGVATPAGDVAAAAAAAAEGGVAKPSPHAGLRFPVVLPGSEKLVVATVTFSSKAARDVAHRKLDGHVLHGAKVLARRGEEVLLRADAYSSSRLIVRNLQFGVGADKLRAMVGLRAGVAGGVGAALLTHIHVPLAAGSVRPEAAAVTPAAAVVASPPDADDEDGEVEGSDSEGEGGGAAAAAAAAVASAATSAAAVAFVEGVEDEAAPAGGVAVTAGGKTGAAAAAPRVRNRGFAFLEFATRNGAAIAMKALNETKVARRLIAVDWAVAPGAAAVVDAPAPAPVPASAASGSSSAADAPSSAPTSTAAAADVTTEAEAGEGRGVEPDGSGKGEDDEADSGGEGSDDDSDGGEDDEEADDAAAASDGSEEKEEGGAPTASTTPAFKSDEVAVGTTLFMRNLPFDADDHALYELMKAFGPLRYARCVMEHGTDRCKGEWQWQSYSIRGARFPAADKLSLFTDTTPLHLNLPPVCTPSPHPQAPPSCSTTRRSRQTVRWRPRGRATRTPPRLSEETRPQPTRTPASAPRWPPRWPPH